jgi:CopG family transcriptional regulator, nickel-responsive regulator
VGAGDNAVGGGAGGRILRAVVDGGIALGAPFAVEALPFGVGEKALGCGGEEAAEGLPGGAEAAQVGIEGLGAGEEGGVDRVQVAAAGLEGAEVEAADAAIGSERDPERLDVLRRAEGFPFGFEPEAGGGFVFDGVFAAAGGVDEPLGGVFDAPFGLGARLREGKRRDGLGGTGAGAEQGEGENGLEKNGFHVIITFMNIRNNTAAAGIARLSLSLPNGLAAELDGLVAAKGASSRSALVADLVRDAVVEHRSRKGRQKIAGTITLVYDHHARNLQAKLTDIQHDAEGLIVSVMHVHLSHHDCLEVLVVRGPAGRVRELADRLAAVRGVKHGRLTITTTGHQG